MKKLKQLLLTVTAFAMLAGATACDMSALGDINIGGVNLGGLLGSSTESESDNSVEELPSESTPDSTPEESAPESSTPDEGDTEEYPVITIAEALELCGEPGNITTERYYIRAIVDSILNPAYGQMRIKDETGTIDVYGTWSADGEIGYASFESKPVKGDEVLLHCILQNYNGTKEIKNARLIEFTPDAEKVDESDYTAMTIDEARDAAVETLVKVEGVVAQITYANGMKPSGVYLVDGTNSIYVYDNDIAGQVSIGNKITVLGSKTYWILEKEQSAASKHGYNGCNQLEAATLVSNDKGNHEFDKSWIEETTVKEIMDTPVSEDITTTIYKVNSLVKKAPGNGFTNYYFNDIDGETGSYVYTQCNGGDFAWIDEFDGKICTVYLSVINAKSTDTGCVYRFLPVLIEDNGYTFNTDDAAEFAVKYYGVDQFAKVYEADPAMEMVTEVSSELLGFSGATLSYASSNEDVVYFTTENGVTTFHCGENGVAKVTITATYGEITYSEEVAIRVQEPIEYDALTVAEAITANIDTEVIVRGIVGPSVVNKNGFYLFGEDGSMIAVLVNDTAEFVGLEIGHEIVLKGTRERYIKDDSYTTHGQTSIVDAEILVNYYGNHEYSTAKFVQATGQDFRALDVTVDYSTTVFVLTGKVEVTETPYYTSLSFTSDGQKITLYCSSANQYAFLKQFSGKEITLEVAACNWNDKTFWAGCALAVYTEDGKILNTLNFDTY